MKCPICQKKAKIKKKDMGRYLKVDCPECGNFEWENDINRLVPNVLECKTKLQYWLRRKDSKRPHLTSKLVKTIIKNTELPSLVEKANRVLLLVGNDLKQPEEQIVLNAPKKNRYVTTIGANKESELAYIIKYLETNNWVNSNVKFAPGAENKIYKGTISMTFLGWSKYESLKTGDSDSKVAFMAMEFDNAKINKAYTHFKSAVSETGFQLFNLQEKPEAGLIDNRLRVEIRRSKFLLANLTNENLGAYWEAGFAEGLGKPVIYLCEKSQFDKYKSHFDTEHQYTIPYEMDALEEAVEDLKATIRNTLPSEAKMEDE